ncbi:MAG: M23 family metallopeptidase [Candidatus Binatia bacterium]
MKAPGAVIALVGLVCLMAQVSSAKEDSWTITVEPLEVFQGGVVEVRVSGEEVGGVKGRFRNQEIPFFRSEGGPYMALLGVDLEEQPGRLGITIEGRTRSGTRKKQPITLRVKKKGFAREKITVPAAFDHFDGATLQRIQKEGARIAQIWKISSPQRWWKGRFIAPVPGKITSPFGLHRVVNGLPRSRHGGVDLKAALGTSIVAANDGRVVLLDNLFFTGKSIVLDHGGGLYTMYFHLSKFLVDAHALVRKGDLMGLAGMTGRVTGPHLHWGVRLNGARIDPMELLTVPEGGKQQVEARKQNGEGERQ